MPVSKRRCPNARAFDEKVSQHLLVIIARQDSSVVDSELTATLLKRLHEVLQVFEILITDHGRFGDQTGRAFQVGESQGAVEFELDFLRIQEVEQDHVMMFEAEML